MKRVLVTKDILDSGIEMLQEKYEVVVRRTSEAMTRQEMLEEFPKYDGIITMLSDQIDKEILEAAPRVKVYANYAVGYNNFDVETGKMKGVAMTNTPDVLSDSTAETAWALLFAASRRIVEADRFVRDGKWNEFSLKLLLGQDVHGKTLGIIGAGRIGERFAEKARGYHMRILYHNRTRRLDFEKRANATYVELDELYAESDFISLHCPLTEETRHLLDADAFKKMKFSAVVINTSRGPVIDEEALVEALRDNQIWGAGLDVFEDEPNVHPELVKMDNVVLLPHIGSATTETREKMSQMAARNIIEVLEGREPINSVY